MMTHPVELRFVECGYGTFDTEISVDDRYEGECPKEVGIAQVGIGSGQDRHVSGSQTSQTVDSVRAARKTRKSALNIDTRSVA